MELKDRIAAVRRAAGLTQEQLGELLGVSRQAVSRWESGQTSPDAATLAALCEGLQVSADYLLGRKIEVKYAPVNGQWNVSGKNADYRNPRVTATYGTQRAMCCWARSRERGKAPDPPMSRRTPAPAAGGLWRGRSALPVVLLCRPRRPGGRGTPSSPPAGTIPTPTPKSSWSATAA